MATGSQIRMAREGLGWSVRELAAKSDVAPMTVSRIENGSEALVGTVQKIEAGLEREGSAFLSEGAGGGPGGPCQATASDVALLARRRCSLAAFPVRAVRCGRPRAAVVGCCARGTYRPPPGSKTDPARLAVSVPRVFGEEQTPGRPLSRFR